MVKAKRKVLAICFTASAMLTAAGGVSANPELVKMQQNAEDWVMPNGNYSSTRYSKLDQINTKNVKNLKVAWTFSTGVLRGHEGGPLVIGFFSSRILTVSANKS